MVSVTGRHTAASEHRLAGRGADVVGVFDRSVNTISDL